MVRRNAALTPAQRSAMQVARMAARTPEQRTESAKKTHATRAGGFYSPITTFDAGVLIAFAPLAWSTFRRAGVKSDRPRRDMYMTTLKLLTHGLLERIENPNYRHRFLYRSTQIGKIVVTV